MSHILLTLSKNAKSLNNIIHNKCNCRACERVVVSIIDKHSPEANNLMLQSLSLSDAYQLDNVARAPTDETVGGCATIFSAGFTDVLCDCFCPMGVGCLDLPGDAVKCMNPCDSFDQSGTSLQQRLDIQDNSMISNILLQCHAKLNTLTYTKCNCRVK